MKEAFMIDRGILNRLEDRLRRGIPRWEQEHFIDQVVPQLVEELKAYLSIEERRATETEGRTIEFPRIKEV